MLGRLYGATCAASLRFTQAFHDSRKFPQGVRSPQTSPQIAQVSECRPCCSGVLCCALLLFALLCTAFLMYTGVHCCVPSGHQSRLSCFGLAPGAGQAPAA